MSASTLLASINPIQDSFSTGTRLSGPNHLLLLISVVFVLVAAVGAITACYYARRQARQQTQQLNTQQQQSLQLQQLQQQITSLVAQREQLQQLLEQQQQAHTSQRQQAAQDQLQTMQMLQQTTQQGLQTLSQQLNHTLQQHNQHSTQKIQELTQSTRQRLQEIGQRVDQQLAAGFEKTTATFGDVMKRLTIIDQAQQKITELSSSVVSLQEVLTDKRARGAFGEVQLESLVRQVLPAAHYQMQQTLSNGKRVDCLLQLPAPTGQVAVDAKFPLESFRNMHAEAISEAERKQVSKQFKLDIKKHIRDIASKYIIPGETSDGAILFIPAEAVFAEIHAHHYELVEMAQHARVWIASPTTMMAILSTARAVLKDAATREQVHIIQQHLHGLSKDFQRFQKRMDNLSRHISQAQQDVSEVHTSSQKISSRFAKIEAVQLQSEQDISSAHPLPTDPASLDSKNVDHAQLDTATLEKLAEQSTNQTDHSHE